MKTMTFAELYEKLIVSPHVNFIIYDKENEEYFLNITETHDGRSFFLPTADNEPSDTCYIRADAVCEVGFFGNGIHPNEQYLTVAVSDTKAYNRNFQIMALTCPQIQL